MRPCCQHIIPIMNGYFGLKHKRPLNNFKCVKLLFTNGLSQYEYISKYIQLCSNCHLSWGGSQIDNKGPKSLEKKWEPRTGEGKVDPGWTSQVVCLPHILAECVYIDYVGKVVEGGITLCYYTFQTYAILECCHGEYFSCLMLTPGHELISENMIKRQNILCLWQRVTVGQGQTSIRCKQSCAFSFLFCHTYCLT